MHRCALAIVVTLLGLAACGRPPPNPPTPPVTTPITPDPEPDPDPAPDPSPDPKPDPDPDPDPDPNPDPDPSPARIVALGAANRFLLRGALLTPSGPIPEGEVLVVDQLIRCAGVSCATAPDADGATIIDSGGVLMPGMIDAHNHILYDVFDADDWSPPAGVFYQNRYQWTNDAAYEALGDLYNSAESTVACEMHKYGEIKALIAGTTSVLSLATKRLCSASLARTIDTYNDLPSDKIRTYTLAISGVSTTLAATLKQQFADQVTTAWVIHLAEGIDEKSRAEFDKLESLGLLAPQTVIIHGTGLGAPEFAKMATHGMKLVWSPRSNMVLYDQTTKIELAKAAGLTIALAPDWSITGSTNLLDELRYTDALDDSRFGGILSPEELFDMVTLNPARALAVDEYLGSLSPGKYADIVAIAGNPAKPYAALLDSDPGDVRLTMVGGKLLYGDAALLDAAFSTTCEALPICGHGKFLCVAEPSSADKLNQSHADVESALGGALPPPLAAIATCR